MGKLGLNSGYIGSDQRTTTNGVVGYDKYFLERLNGRFLPVVQNLDFDYFSILEYATTQGYTLPSSGQQVLQNQLINNLKNAGIWDELDTFAVFATDGDQDFALIDWKRLTNYTAYNAVTFTPNVAIQGNGSTSWIDTNYSTLNDSTKYTLNNACRFAYVSIDSTIRSFASGYVIDGIEGSFANRLQNGDQSAQRINQGTAILSSGWTGMFGGGMRSIHRQNSTQVVLGADKVYETRSVNSLQLETNNQLLGVASLNTAGQQFANTGFACYGCGSNLLNEFDELIDIFAAYFNAL